MKIIAGVVALALLAAAAGNNLFARHSGTVQSPGICFAITIAGTANEKPEEAPLSITVKIKL